MKFLEGLTLMEQSVKIEEKIFLFYLIVERFLVEQGNGKAVLAQFCPGDHHGLLGEFSSSHSQDCKDTCAVLGRVARVGAALPCTHHGEDGGGYGCYDALPHWMLRTQHSEAASWQWRQPAPVCYSHTWMRGRAVRQRSLRDYTGANLACRLRTLTTELRQTRR